MTIKTLLEAAEVKTGDGNWMGGYEAGFDVVGRTYSVNGRVCDPTTTPNPSGDRALFNIVPLVMETKQKFSTFCEPAVADKSAGTDLDDSSEYLVAHNFWNGDAVDWDGLTEGVFLTDAAVETVAAGTSVAASIGAALAAAYAKTPSLKPILHLGVTSALALGPNAYTASDALTVVVSPGYPPSGIAVTGPVKINLSEPQVVGLIDQGTNDVLAYANRFATVEFDPRLAVRVA